MPGIENGSPESEETQENTTETIVKIIEERAAFRHPTNVSETVGR
jgi:hypothetical protein